MKVKPILKILNVLGILGAILWLMANPSWEPLITVIGLIGSFIALMNSNKEDATIYLRQKGGKKSTNYQSARDINIGWKDEKK
jgi:hypothetical protein